MNRVHITAQAQALFGLIERDNAADPSRLARIRQALHKIIADLRQGGNWIGSIPSSKHAGAYVLHEMYLRAHFWRRTDGAILIIDVEELGPS